MAASPRLSLIDHVGSMGNHSHCRRGRNEARSLWKQTRQHEHHGAHQDTTFAVTAAAADDDL